jgi:hypothetical protein
VPAQSVADTLRVSALMLTNPARITLSWPAGPTASTLSRKTRDATIWARTLPRGQSRNVISGGSLPFVFPFATLFEDRKTGALGLRDGKGLELGRGAER